MMQMMLKPLKKKDTDFGLYCSTPLAGRRGSFGQQMHKCMHAQTCNYSLKGGARLMLTPEAPPPSHPQLCDPGPIYRHLKPNQSGNAISVQNPPQVQTSYGKQHKTTVFFPALVVVSCDSHYSFSAHHPVKTIHEGGVRALKCKLGFFSFALCAMWTFLKSSLNSVETSV